MCGPQGSRRQNDAVGCQNLRFSGDSVDAFDACDPSAIEVQTGDCDVGSKLEATFEQAGER